MYKDLFCSIINKKTNQLLTMVMFLSQTVGFGDFVTIGDGFQNAALVNMAYFVSRNLLNLIT